MALDTMQEKHGTYWHKWLFWINLSGLRSMFGNHRKELWWKYGSEKHKVPWLWQRIKIWNGYKSNGKTFLVQRCWMQNPNYLWKYEIPTQKSLSYFILLSIPEPDKIKFCPEWLHPVQYDERNNKVPQRIFEKNLSNSLLFLVKLSNSSPFLVCAGNSCVLHADAYAYIIVVHVTTLTTFLMKLSFYMG